MGILAARVMLAIFAASLLGLGIWLKLLARDRNLGGAGAAVLGALALATLTLAGPLALAAGGKLGHWTHFFRSTVYWLGPVVALGLVALGVHARKGSAAAGVAAAACLLAPAGQFVVANLCGDFLARLFQVRLVY